MLAGQWCAKRSCKEGRIESSLIPFPSSGEEPPGLLTSSNRLRPRWSTWKGDKADRYGSTIARFARIKACLRGKFEQSDNSFGIAFWEKSSYKFSENLYLITSKSRDLARKKVTSEKVRQHESKMCFKMSGYNWGYYWLKAKQTRNRKEIKQKEVGWHFFTRLKQDKLLNFKTIFIYTFLYKIKTMRLF